MSVYNHILFATDLTEISEKIVPKVTEICETYGAKLSLIHVIEPIPAYGYPGVTDLESPVIEHAKQAMHELAEKFSLPNQHQHIEFGSVKAQVLRVAKELNSDLIIVGSHGRHGLARLLGSSAGAIVNGAECDVLLLRAPMR